MQPQPQNTKLNTDYLEHLRAKKGYSKAKVSALMGMHEGHYRKALNGTILFKADDIMKLINIYSMNNEQILKLFHR